MKLTTIALLTPVFLTACATTENPNVITGELEATKVLPTYPSDCRKLESADVRDGERLDVALLRMDQALGRANARTKRCAEWYDGIRSGFNPSVK